MKCNRQTQEQIVSLSLGELSLWRGWLLRRHIATCPGCRTKWEQTRAVTMELRNMASAPVSKALPIGIPGVSAPQREQEFTPSVLTKEIPQMRRLKFVVAGLAMLLLIAGGVTAQLFQFKPSGGFSDHEGRMWRIVTDFKGEIRGLDTQGHPMGTFLTDTGDPNQGTVDLTVDGRSYHFQGPGRYPVSDSKNALIGTLVLDPKPPVHHWKTVPAVSGVTTTTDGVQGFDRALGLTWSTRGPGSVTATDAAGNLLAQATPQHVPGRETNLTEPEITATINGVTQHEKGFGTHTFKDSTEKVIVVLTLTPTKP